MSFQIDKLWFDRENLGRIRLTFFGSPLFDIRKRITDKNFVTDEYFLVLNGLPGEIFSLSIFLADYCRKSEQSEPSCSWFAQFSPETRLRGLSNRDVAMVLLGLCQPRLRMLPGPFGERGRRNLSVADHRVGRHEHERRRARKPSNRHKQSCGALGGVGNEARSLRLKKFDDRCLDRIRSFVVTLNQ